MYKSEEEVVSVFAHWTKRNQQHMTYEYIKSGVHDRGIHIRHIAAEMDWGHFSPSRRMSASKCQRTPTRRGTPSRTGNARDGD